MPQNIDNRSVDRFGFTNPPESQVNAIAGERARERADGRSVEEIADEVGGIPEEIRDWIENGVIGIVDPAAARARRICDEDFRLIERHQIDVDIQRCFKHPEEFLDTRFERFGDQTPRELLAGDDADLVRDLVWQVKSGVHS